MNTVYLTENAFRDIVVETADHLSTETGGILLGEATPQGWFVVEVLDPGPRAVRTGVYFEYNHSYATHLANKVSRRYQKPLHLLGLWHRHPGSLDTFSGTDNETHQEFLALIPGGIISGLVNIDPEFRMTFYKIERPLRCQPIQVAVGNRHFPPALLLQKDAVEVARGFHRTPSGPRRGIEVASSRTARPPESPASRAVPVPTPPAPPQRSWLWNMFGGSRPTDPGNTPARVYTPYGGQEAEAPTRTRQTSQEQKLLLDLLDTEFDFLDSRSAAYQYRVSPQDSGFKLEVFLAPGASASLLPTNRQEFVFYVKPGGQPMVYFDGREQVYQTGLLRRLYEPLESSSASKLPGATLDKGAATPSRTAEGSAGRHVARSGNPSSSQEQRHEGPPPNRSHS